MKPPIESTLVMYIGNKAVLLINLIAEQWFP